MKERIERIYDNELDLELPLYHKNNRSIDAGVTTIRNRYLVVLRAHDHSCHKQWLKPKGSKNFDLLIDYYGDQPNRYLHDADYYMQSKGLKYPGIYRILNRLGQRLWDYEAVWFPDDDIGTDAQNINEMFRLFSTYNLWLAQPALTQDSYYSHDITVERNGVLLRYTNFVEVMVPIFSPYALKKCMHTFPYMRSGWGMDFVWPKLLGDPKNKIAILDRCSVTHTRPVASGGWYHSLHVPPEQEKKQTARAYGVKLPYPFQIYDWIHDQ